MRALALVADAYGGRGGVAQYNRFLLEALCSHPDIEHVAAIPRAVHYELGELPKALRFYAEGAGGKLKFARACLRAAIHERQVSLIVCAHIHLLPLAYFLGVRFRCPVVAVIYGIDAWAPTSHAIVNSLCKRLHFVISIRQLTTRLFSQWAGLRDATHYYLPNCIDEAKYGVRSKNALLLDRYGLRGKRVIVTAGRLDTAPDEQRKGFDEVLEALPELRKQAPDIAYLIVGDGDDRERLARKAKGLGVDDVTVFTGYVSEEEKADHYRLADVFAMPGSNPNFDRYPFRFVFLEALACGIPVVGSRLEDPEEVADPDARLIIQVDPCDRRSIIDGILMGLSQERPKIQPALHKFGRENFTRRLHAIVRDVLDRSRLHSAIGRRDA